MVTNINFLLTISIDCQEQSLWELINGHKNVKSKRENKSIAEEKGGGGGLG